MVVKPITKLELTRRQKGFRAKELAKRMEISPVIVSQIETGERKPYPKFKRLASEILEVPEDILFPGGETHGSLNS